MTARKRMASLRVRIALGIGGLTVGVVALAFVVLQTRERGVRRHVIEDQVSGQGELIISGLERAMLEEGVEHHFELVTDMISRLVRQPEVRRIEILDKTGTIRVSSAAERIGTRLDPSHPSCRACHDHEPLDRSVFSWVDNPGGGTSLRHAAPIRNRRACQACHGTENRLNGVLLAEYAPFSDQPAAAGYTWLLALLLIGGGLTSLLAFFLVDVLVTRRLGAFVERIRSIPETHQASSHSRRRDEIDRLQEAFDAMVRNLEEERRQLVQQEKLASLGELAGSIAHEINNPIGIIISHLELLRTEMDDFDADEEVLVDLEVVERHVRRIASTVSGLLSFSRHAPGSLASVDVNELIEDLLVWAGGQYRDRGMRVDFRPGRDLPHVRARPEQLTEVLLNLLNNASDAMPNGGSALITTALLTSDSPRVSIAVSDEGPGVPERDREHIFEPFFTTKAPGTGTGLGLSVCHRIVTEHGGSLVVGEGPGGGAVFEIRLPVESRLPETARASHAADPPGVPA